MSRNISRLDIHGHPRGADAAGGDATRADSASPEVVAASHAASAQISRHVAAEHIAAVSRPKPMMRSVLAGVGLLGVAAIGIWWVDRTATRAAADAALASQDTRTVSTRIGQRASFELDDGSRVTLGAATQLRIIPDFGLAMRVVGLEGSADFTVAAHEDPLWIRAGDLSVIVDSGSLAVAAYPGETALVSARGGDIEVRTSAGERTLVLGEAVIVSADGSLRDASAADLNEALAWIDGNVIIAGRQLKEALPILRRWFGTEVTVADTGLLYRVVSATAPLGSSRILIEGFEQSGGLKLEWKDRQMVLADGRE